MCFHFSRMRISFLSKGTRVHKATTLASSTSLCCTILVLFVGVNPGRSGWNFPYEQTTKFVPVTGLIWRGSAWLRSPDWLGMMSHKSRMDGEGYTICEATSGLACISDRGTLVCVLSMKGIPFCSMFKIGSILHYWAHRLRLNAKKIQWFPLFRFPSQHNFSAHLSLWWDYSIDRCHQLAHDTRLVINCLIIACLHLLSQDR